MRALKSLVAASFLAVSVTGHAVGTIPTNGIITTVDENYPSLHFTSDGGDKQKAMGEFSWVTYRLSFSPSGSFTILGMLNDLPPRVERQTDISVWNWDAAKTYRVVVRQKSQTTLAYFDNNMNDGAAHYQAQMNASMWCIGSMMQPVQKAANGVEQTGEKDVAPAAENTSATKLDGPQYPMEVTLTHDFPAGQHCVEGMLFKIQATGQDIKLAPLEISILELGAPL